MPEEIPCQPSGLMEVEGGTVKKKKIESFRSSESWEKIGELEYADKNRKVSCVIRCWRYSSELLS